jgi:hypothetical protein
VGTYFDLHKLERLEKCLVEHVLLDKTLKAEAKLFVNDLNDLVEVVAADA